MKTENKQRIIDFLQSNCQEANAHIDFSYALKNADFETADDIYELLLDDGYMDVEIIYYTNAIEYLKENDNSLRTSLEIAANYGFELKNLSSETLASLLASENVKTEIADSLTELQELINEINEEESEEETKD